MVLSLRQMLDTAAVANLSFSGHLDVAVRSRDAEMVRQAAAVFSAGKLPPAQVTAAVPSLHCEVEAPGPESRGRYTVWVDGTDVYASDSRPTVLWFIEGLITERLTRRLTAYHLFHGGVVKFRGRVIVLPGQSGAGKSTTVAALALSGAEFYSDEVAVLDSSLNAHPFPRVLGLKQGGWAAVQARFPKLAAQGVVSAEPGAHMAYVRPPVLPPEGAPPLAVDCILLPSRDPGGEARLERVSRSAGLSRLVDQSLDMPLWRRTGFEAIVRLAQQAECYALNVSDVDGTLRAMEALPEVGF
jgi:hypothetical protein